MIHFKQLQYWIDRGYIRAGSRVMDVGTQHLLFSTLPESVAMIETLRSSSVTSEKCEQLKRLCEESHAKRAFVHDWLMLAGVRYHSIDIFNGPVTSAFDLNHDTAPDHWRGKFDVAINVGTLEHVIHQANAVQFIHDVLRVGGLWLEQSPSIGYLNHGYFQYHPQFYRDLAAANGYEILEAWYSKAGSYQTLDTSYALIDLDNLDSQEERDKVAAVVNEIPTEQQSLAYNFNAVILKTRAAPFRYPLESRTTCSPVAPDIAARYGVSQ